MNVKMNENSKTYDHALVHLATKQLEDILGKSAATVSADWERCQDEKGRPLYSLTISDSSAQVTAKFTPDDLQSPRQMRLRLLELWGDLLQFRSHKQLERLMEPSSQADSGDP